MKTQQFTKTRTVQRKLATFLKGRGIKATCARNKSDQGWAVNIPSLSRKRLKNAGAVCNGRLVPVVTK